MLAQFVEQVQAPHPRQRDIQEQQIQIGVLLDQAAHRVAFGRLQQDHLALQRAEQLTQCVPQQGMIVRDEDFHRWRPPLLPSPTPKRRA